jgi:hypothetical protein
VIADVVFGSGGGARYTPPCFRSTARRFSRDDVVTSSIETLLYAFGGAFQIKPAEGMKGERARSIALRTSCWWTT